MLKRCLSCKFFQPKNEIDGTCRLDKKNINKLPNKVCKKYKLF